MPKYTPAWPHGDIETVFDEVFTVRGTNITTHEGFNIQHSRNMTILKQGDDLALINSVRLDDEGLYALDKLGKVKYIFSIGAFHGRDDAFYCKRYGASLWTVKPLACDAKVQHALDKPMQLPIENLSYMPFEDASPLEGFLYLNRYDGIIIGCDSIKNWTKIDKYFGKETAKLAIEQGEITAARISPIWLKATGVKPSSFNRLLALKFKHLISAHGEVLKETAHDAIKQSVEKINLS